MISWLLFSGVSGARDAGWLPVRGSGTQHRGSQPQAHRPRVQSDARPRPQLGTSVLLHWSKVRESNQHEFLVFCIKHLISSVRLRLILPVLTDAAWRTRSRSTPSTRRSSPFASRASSSWETGRSSTSTARRMCAPMSTCQLSSGILHSKHCHKNVLEWDSVLSFLDKYHMKLLWNGVWETEANLMTQRVSFWQMKAALSRGDVQSCVMCCVFPARMTKTATGPVSCRISLAGRGRSTRVWRPARRDADAPSPERCTTPTGDPLSSWTELATSSNLRGNCKNQVGLHPPFCPGWTM